MSKSPKSVQKFVAARETVPVKSIWEPSDRFFLYGAYWYRAVACLLLSGRVAPKYGGSPNRTELARVCKEANIDEYSIEPMGTLLMAGRVLSTTRRDTYEEGPNAAKFWRRDPEGFRTIIKEGSNPDNFVLRCRALGFEVETLNGSLRVWGWVKK